LHPSAKGNQLSIMIGAQFAASVSPMHCILALGKRSFLPFAKVARDLSSFEWQVVAESSGRQSLNRRPNP
jgi:hypothetical protein